MVLELGGRRTQTSENASNKRFALPLGANDSRNMPNCRKSKPPSGECPASAQGKRVSPGDGASGGSRPIPEDPMCPPVRAPHVLVSSGGASICDQRRRRLTLISTGHVGQSEAGGSRVAGRSSMSIVDIELESDWPCAATPIHDRFGEMSGVPLRSITNC